MIRARVGALRGRLWPPHLAFAALRATRPAATAPARRGHVAGAATSSRAARCAVRRSHASAAMAWAIRNSAAGVIDVTAPAREASAGV